MLRTREQCSTPRSSSRTPLKSPTPAVTSLPTAVSSEHPGDEDLEQFKWQLSDHVLLLDKMVRIKAFPCILWTDRMSKQCVQCQSSPRSICRVKVGGTGCRHCFQHRLPCKVDPAVLQYALTEPLLIEQNAYPMGSPTTTEVNQTWDDKIKRCARLKSRQELFASTMARPAVEGPGKASPEVLQSSKRVSRASSALAARNSTLSSSTTRLRNPSGSGCQPSGRATRKRTSSRQSVRL